MDDHLTTVMFLDKDKRTLDYNFLLWKYDTTKLDHVSLAKLDKGSSAAENEGEVAENPSKRQCCTLF